MKDSPNLRVMARIREMIRISRVLEYAIDQMTLNIQ